MLRVTSLNKWHAHEKPIVTATEAACGFDIGEATKCCSFDDCSLRMWWAEETKPALLCAPLKQMVVEML